MLPFPSSARPIRYRVSTQLKVFTGVFLLAVGGTTVFLLASGHEDRNFFIALGCCLVLLISVHLQQFGYRIAYDDVSIYWRRWGFLNGLNIRPQVTKIDWVEVTSVESNVGEPFGRDGDFLPFEMIEVRTGNGRRIPLYPCAMDPDDFEEIASYMRYDRQLAV